MTGWSPETKRTRGKEFLAVNVRPQVPFTEAVSFHVEIERFWDQLTERGEEGKCGRLKDPFGLTLQIVPDRNGRAAERSRPCALRRQPRRRSCR
jgi:predicted 3-demethylubiquinone-9 3-methyltransferase (glyoxalase superfamily)